MDRETLFATALKDHGDALWRVCRAYGRDDAERADLHQEVLLRAWSGLADFRGDCMLATWLYRVAINTCLTWRRGEARREARVTTVRDETLERWPTRSTSTLAVQSNLARLYACIARLTELERVLVSLYLEDMSSVHIAEVLGIREGNVRIRLHRAKERLKELWEEVGDEPR